MSSKRDYYDILGISKNATENEIKKAYRTLVKKYHPDVSKEANATEKFKEIQEAYQILSNPEKKRDYDRFGHRNDYNNFNSNNFKDFSQEFNFEDIFENFFGSSKNKQSQKRNRDKIEDKNINITIDFLEACLGVEKEIQFQFEEDCHECNGTGAKSKEDIQTCYYCDGKGYIKRTKMTFLGSVSTQQVCSYCQGKGRIIIKKCLFCKGLKRVSGIKKVKVSIPAGIESGMTIKIKNQGNKIGNYNSDLYINVEVKSHSLFERKNQDIYTNLWINFYDAILGNDFSVSTIHGEVNLRIPEGTQSHTQFRLKNKGVPYLNSSYQKGHHYVIVKVKTPQKLTSHQKKLIQQIKELDQINENTKKNKSWFF
ncbi:MAG: molecular chaperone DnaJ [Candidatus Phytoplasma stylosanthis]|nr:molecular chaperone DnaJ [Candidatus Phytoplasma stylosanthis]